MTCADDDMKQLRLPNIDFEKNYRAFFLTYGLFVFLPLLLIVWSALFLWRSHEFASYEKIIAYQQKNHAIYGPGTVVDYFEYKLKMVLQKQPETVVLGSSRALGFQGKYLKSSFVNAGLAMRSLEEGKLFLEEMLSVYSPKRIIFTIDFWWFNKETPLPSLTYKKFNKQEISSDKLLLPFQLIKDKKLTVAQFLEVVLGYRKNQLTHYENTGVMGIIFSNGIRPDGSMLYAEFALGGREDLDPRFAHTAELIAKNFGNYEYGEHIFQERLQLFQEIIALCQRHNIQVYAVLPPIAPKVYKLMQSKPLHYQYVTELRNKIQNLNIPVFDFHEAQSIPASDCEFVDGYHSGDLTYIKMLLKMAEAAPTEDLTEIINLSRAKNTIAMFDGQVLDRSNPKYFPQQMEKDFLQLGCKKK